MPEIQASLLEASTIDAGNSGIDAGASGIDAGNSGIETRTSPFDAIPNRLTGDARQRANRRLQRSRRVVRWFWHAEALPLGGRAPNSSFHGSDRRSRVPADVDSCAERDLRPVTPEVAVHSPYIFGRNNITFLHDLPRDRSTIDTRDVAPMWACGDDAGGDALAGTEVDEERGFVAAESRRCSGRGPSSRFANELRFGYARLPRASESGARGEALGKTMRTPSGRSGLETTTSTSSFLPQCRRSSGQRRLGTPDRGRAGRARDVPRARHDLRRWSLFSARIDFSSSSPCDSTTVSIVARRSRPAARPS